MLRATKFFAMTALALAAASTFAQISDETVDTYNAAKTGVVATTDAMAAQDPSPLATTVLVPARDAVIDNVTDAIVPAVAAGIEGAWAAAVSPVPELQPIVNVPVVLTQTADDIAATVLTGVLGAATAVVTDGDPTSAAGPMSGAATGVAAEVTALPGALGGGSLPVDPNDLPIPGGVPEIPGGSTPTTTANSFVVTAAGTVAAVADDCTVNATDTEFLFDTASYNSDAVSFTVTCGAARTTGKDIYVSTTDVTDIGSTTDSYTVTVDGAANEATALVVAGADATAGTSIAGGASVGTGSEAGKVVNLFAKLDSTAAAVNNGGAVAFKAATEHVYVYVQ